MSETSHLKYKTLPEYRAKVLARTKEYHRTHKDNPLYCRIVKCRSRIWGLKEKIKAYQNKIRNARQSLKYYKDLKETLYAERRQRGILVRAYTPKKTKGDARIPPKASK